MTFDKRTQKASAWLNIFTKQVVSTRSRIIKDFRIYSDANGGCPDRRTNTQKECDEE